MASTASERECKMCAKSYNGVNSLPMVFPCGHSTCHECATKIWLRAKAFQCPFCRVCAHKISVTSFGAPTSPKATTPMRDLTRSSSTSSDSSTDSDLLEEYGEPNIPASLVQLVAEFPKITRTSYLHSRTGSA
ncbi:hypothetical protein AAVH_09941 [Aphelenchoides avenae]|nr:hypothetical protein AAVH_09941 [Aphelenchus avenae]